MGVHSLGSEWGWGLRGLVLIVLYTQHVSSPQSPVHEWGNLDGIPRESVRRRGDLYVFIKGLRSNLMINSIPSELCVPCASFLQRERRVGEWERQVFGGGRVSNPLLPLFFSFTALSRNSSLLSTKKEHKFFAPES